MAGEQGNRTSCSEDEIQSMVRGIFGQLFEGSGTRRRSNVQGNSCSSQPSSSDRNELFLNDVYLLPRPTYDRVRRREAKANLQKEGFCIDAFTFDKRWDEQTLCDKMAMLFRKIFKDVTRYWIFKSEKVIYNFI
jgi:hypothetical protein